MSSNKPPDIELERDHKERYEHLLQVWDAAVAIIIMSASSAKSTVFRFFN